MPAFITNTVHIQRYADAVYGVQVGSATLAQVNQDITSLGGIDKALNAYFAGSGQTNATVAANIVKNAGIVVGGTITAAAVTDATAYVLGQLNANKGNEGATIKNILNLVGNLTADPIYGAAAVKFNADVDRAVSYAGATDIAAGVVVAAAPFALTANTDTWTGTAGNDSVAGTEANFSVLDSLAAGAGTDTLTLSLASATNSLSSFNISGFENLVLTQGTADNTGTGVVLSLPDVTSITNIGSTKVSIISGITNAATALTIAGTSQNTTFIASEAAVAGTSDTAAVTLNAVTGAAQVNINTATANTAGFEAINLVSAGGTANSITLETNDTAGLATLTISGAQDVTVAAGTNLSTTAKTINASAATGKVTITGLGAAVHTITGGGAADSFTFGANYVGGSTGATRDIIDGGAGRDTLSITVARAVDTVATTNQTNLTSIEILTISDAWTTGANIDLTKFVGVDTVTLPAAVAGTSSMTVNSGTAVTLGVNTGTDAVTTFVVGGTGVNDSMTLNMAGFDWTTGGTSAFSTTGIETLNITTGTTVTDAATMSGTTTMTASAGSTGGVINVTGANAMTFTGVVTAAAINASGLTGILTVTATPANSVSITGGSAADVITGSATADLIVGGNGADVITPGAGNDTIDLTETTVAIDKVVFAAVANTDTAAQGLAKTGLNTITGFGTTDTLNIAGLGDGTTSATGLVTVTAAAAQGAFTDDVVYIINVGVTAGSLTTGGTAAITDFTNMTQVSAFLGERFTVADAAVEGVVVLNTTGTTYIYQVSGDATAGAMAAADIALVGVVAQTAALTTSNLVYA